ncbi:hypothetical protein DDD63_01330 [Actinobaculum sp. 313]|nr:hypothetical protein DDD63_01330 [Actinobaculum sp. 313]
MVGQSCEENAGDLLPYVGTEYAAQDMDVMRALVGDEKLNYVGFSYGTSLGGQYADLFPHNVGRMILDGAVDTTVGSAQMSHDQSLGFETALRNYVDDCRGGNACPSRVRLTTLWRRSRNSLRSLWRSHSPQAMRIAP